MRVQDGRRLTGRSHWADGPAAAVVVAFEDGESIVDCRTRWRQRVEADMAALGWPAPTIRQAPAGVEEVWTATAPIDRLYAAVALCEAAVTLADAAARAAQIAAEPDAGGDPALLAIQAFALAHDVPLLWDDDELSLGWGASCARWLRSAPPDVATLAPERFGRVPSALITGTNGKTTTTRLLARMARESGLHAGTTSTDGLTLDGRLVEAGDWTGPGGARALLRDPRVEFAVLEAARGGMLRRGLGVDRVDAAAVTNVSADHLGEWGIDTVAAMAGVKLLVADAVRPGGSLVIGDDRQRGDVLVRALQARALPPDVRVLRYAAVAAETVAPGPGRLAGWVEGATLVVDDGEGSPLRLPLAEIPITVAGAALHNVENALCAALLARSLGLPDAAIVAGLRAFRPDPTDSPGRGNLLTLRGGRVLLDFGHNPDGVRRVAEFAARVPAARRLVVVGQAGDRSDEDICGLVDGLWPCAPDVWLLKAMPHYDRGRADGEVVAILRAALLDRGVADDAVRSFASEHDAAAAAIAALQPGDLLVLLAHEDAASVLAQLLAAGAQLGWG